MVEMAVQKGFIPALVVLWCNFVKDSWASKDRPENIMPLDAVESYARYVAECFAEYNPIYFISGDTKFESDTTVLYYIKALKVIKSISPDALTTMHLCGGLHDLPEVYIEDKDIDFYMYQSSHGFESHHSCYKLA